MADEPIQLIPPSSPHNLVISHPCNSVETRYKLGSKPVGIIERQIFERCRRYGDHYRREYTAGSSRNYRGWHAALLIIATIRQQEIFPISGFQIKSLRVRKRLLVTGHFFIDSLDCILISPSPPVYWYIITLVRGNFLFHAYNAGKSIC